MVKNDKNEKIVIIGFGWVGQANALALTRLGYEVFYYDIIEPPRFYKDKYGELYKRLKPLKNPLEKDGQNTCYLICVGDKVADDGIQNISLIEKALISLKPAKGTVILRSTVLPQHLKNLDFDLYMPEFLHEKFAIEEVLHPFYFVLGRPDSKIEEPKFLKELESRSKKIFRGTPEEASNIKYLSNIWNALRIAFVNEFGNLIAAPKSKDEQKQIEKIINFVFENKNYLRYGCSFGGHCLPKDFLAFLSINKDKNAGILKAAFRSNLIQKELEKEFGHLPEWFSNWEGERIFFGSKLPALLEEIKANPMMKISRKTIKYAAKFLESLTPERSLEQTKAIWNDLARKNPRYFMNTKTKSGESVDEFEIRETGQIDYERYVAKDDLLCEKLGDFNDKKALDIGCGIGRMTEFFAKDFNKVYGVDISERLIESAKKRLSQFSNVRLSVNNGADYPCENNFFNFVLSYLVFQYVPILEAIEQNLKEIHRVLVPGGIAKIQLRTGPSLWRWRWFYGISLSPETAIALAQKAGFKVLKTEVEGVKNLWLWLEK